MQDNHFSSLSDHFFLKAASCIQQQCWVVLLFQRWDQFEQSKSQFSVLQLSSFSPCLSVHTKSFKLWSYLLQTHITQDYSQMVSDTNWKGYWRAVASSREGKNPQYLHVNFALYLVHLKDLNQAFPTPLSKYRVPLVTSSMFLLLLGIQQSLGKLYAI